jgi:ABC-type Fe3+-hydroxamate transport system substrate-binding protein
MAALGLAHLLVAVDRASQERLSAAVPEATWDVAVSRHPDLVLVPPPPADRQASIEEMRAAGVRVLEVAPHDLSDAFELYREIAQTLGDEARGRSTAQRIGDPLARMSARNLGKRRPRVAALISLDPPVLAGGHSFVTDLIEAAGAETITHGDDVAQVPRRLDEIRAAAPELIVIAAPARPAEEAERFVRSWFEPVPVAILPIDTAELWLAGSLDAAIALQDLVDGVRSDR